VGGSGSGRAGMSQGVADRLRHPGCVVAPVGRLSRHDGGCRVRREGATGTPSGDAVRVDRGRLDDACLGAMQTLQGLRPGLDRGGAPGIGGVSWPPGCPVAHSARQRPQEASRQGAPGPPGHPCHGLCIDL